jgi:hypothetical protein
LDYIEGSGIHSIPGLDSNYKVVGWSPDGGSVYAIPSRVGEKTVKVYKANSVTGKMELWRTLGAEGAAGVWGANVPYFSRDGTAYAYGYSRVLSQAYVMTGLK